jgi:hypothetical protein
MITDYQFGQITINNQDYYYDVMVDWQGKVEKWWREESHKVKPSDIEKALSLKPEVIVIGTGESGIAEVLPETQQEIINNGTGLIIEKTSKAISFFNENIKKGKKVVGLFHLTC